MRISVESIRVQTSPRPRIDPLVYTPVEWPNGKSLRLQPRNATLDVDLVRLLEDRETRRHFPKKVTIELLGQLLWLSCRSRSSRPSEFGFNLDSRPTPSAGAIHPVHVLISREPGEPWSRYDPAGHCLVEINGSEIHADTARAIADQVVPLDEAVFLAFVAEPDKTAAKYEHSQSLVWRDAGVLLGYLSLISEALDLNFCPLGATGNPHMAELLGHHSDLTGVGFALIGMA